MAEASGHSRLRLHAYFGPDSFGSPPDKREVNLCGERFRWRVLAYQPHAPVDTLGGKQHYLQIGDLVRLRCADTDAYIAASTAGEKVPYSQRTPGATTAKQIFIIERPEFGVDDALCCGDN
eukprot:g3079.t1